LSEDCIGVCGETPGCTHYTWTEAEGGSCTMFEGDVTKEDAFVTDDLAMICGILNQQ
jgi:hypothetical protein